MTVNTDQVDDWKLIVGDRVLEFGKAGSRPFWVLDQDIGSASFDVGDLARPSNDDFLMGVDHRRAAPLTFKILVNEYSVRAAMDRRDEFVSLWNSDSIRNTPGATAMLVNQARGRVTYGRTRQIAFDEEYMSQGAPVITATFRPVTSYWFSQEWRGVQIPFLPEVRGGFTAPFSGPIGLYDSFAGSARSLTVGGLEPAYVHAEIVGPVSKPSIDVGGLWRIESELSLGENDRLVVSSTPWSPGVWLNDRPRPDGVRAGGVFFDDMRVPPGTHHVTFGGSSPSLTASMSLAAQDVFLHY